MAAAWIRELIAANLIPNGHVDTRSIADVQPEDLDGYCQCHFFCGIAGWPLALQLAGWPQDEPVWSGSCPCQPFSSAGSQAGTNDERHLWPEFMRLIRARRPSVVFGEQVASSLVVGSVKPKTRKEASGDPPVWLDGISADLEQEGYAVGSVVLGAHSVGAPHIRQRLFWGASWARTPAGYGPLGRRRSNGTGFSVPHSGGGGVADRLDDGLQDGRSGGNAPDQRGYRSRDSYPDDVSTSAEFRADGRLADVQQQGLEGLAGHGDHGHEPGRDGAQASGSVAPDGTGGNGESGRLPGDGREQRGPKPGGRGAPGGCESGGVDNPAGARCKEHESCLLPGVEQRREAGGLADATGERRTGERVLLRSETGGRDEVGVPQTPGGGGSGFWDAYDLIPCRDGKVRRIERKSLALADGVSDLLDALRHAGASEEQVEAALETFPLARNQPGRVMLLRGFGNAICVPTAASFVRAFMET